MRTSVLVGLIFLAGILLGDQFLLAPQAIRLSIIATLFALGALAVYLDKR